MALALLPLLSFILSTPLLLLFYPIVHGSNLKCASPDNGSTLRVMHVYSQCSPFRSAKPVSSWEDMVLDMAANDDARLQYLTNLVAGKSVLPIASGRQITQSATYVVRVNVGTPSQTMLMAMDTSSDAAWIPCTGCVGCGRNRFTSAKSTTFKTLGCKTPQCKQVWNPSCTNSTCTFNQTYGSSTFSANLTHDTIKLAMDAIPNYVFGCIRNVAGGNTVLPQQGLLGLGRGPMSLLSQTQNLYKSTFSYCLPNFKSQNFSGSLRLGPYGQPQKIKYTPLLKNPKRSSLYYVKMIGIRVGRKTIDIPPSDPNTGAGTIFDSGTVFTRLVTSVYNAVRNEFRRRVEGAGGGTVTSLGGFDTCYNGKIVAPPISLHFAGMNVSLPMENVLIQSTYGSLSCLAMAAAPDNVNSVVNVIANMQQQNFRILFDVPNSRVGVAREQCT
ncbi:hypothetical protein GIB67_025834 [Kingdonia uniflora]|uniref:Peptidase A1 domain-containing protein n=1 Tax=Kingdonia uniflora TaxID=39325 RepID=A0A7J7N582_9MAGN|nr:hypothetical protein GIB67_025834 [Kingdonia uniflora]